MGYTTEYSGTINIEPALNAQEIAYINKFIETRRMKRTKGPYYIGDNPYDMGGVDVLDINNPDPSQPGLWCHWQASEDGTYIAWDGGEKFYYGKEWMEYYMEHFIGDTPKAAKEYPFFTGHKCNGVIKAQGEDMDDRWKLIVKDNVVTTKGLE